MNLALNLQLSPQEAVPTLALSLIDRLREQLEQPKLDGASVHEVRKIIKQLRALLRLVESELKASHVRMTDRNLRRIARALGDAREAEVRLATLAKVGQPVLEAGAYDQVVTCMQGERAHVVVAPAVLEPLRGVALQLREAILSWAPASAGFNAYRASIKENYRQGRRCLKAVERDPGHVRSWHDLRKVGKYLRYQCHFLEQAWPPVMVALQEELHQLTDYLGDDHDANDLSSWLAKQDWCALENSQRQRLRHALNQYSAGLQAAALPLLQRLYTEKPKHFVRRLEGYYVATEAVAGSTASTGVDSITGANLMAVTVPKVPAH